MQFSLMVLWVGGIAVSQLIVGIGWWAAVLMVVWLVPYFVILRVSERGVRRAVRANRGEVCWQCWYPLHGVDAAVCPECGTPFTPDELRAEWDHVNWLLGGRRHSGS